MLENKSYDPRYTFMLAGLRYVVPVSRLFFRAFAPRALAGCWAAGPGAPWKQGARRRRGSGGSGRALCFPGVSGPEQGTAVGRGSSRSVGRPPGIPVVAVSPIRPFLSMHYL